MRRTAGQHQRVAVCARAGGRAGTDRAGGAGLVFDDDGHAQARTQLFRQDAGAGVGGAAGRKRHPERDGLVGIGIGGVDGRAACRQGEACAGGCQQAPAHRVRNSGH
ncbi:hypothetical protein G6F31_019643 [Rhizopus arrhizus]|nr:hypothetical protein G6F31_019643 [Rhizopus arrhizus]